MSDEMVSHPKHYNWLPNGLEVIDLTEHLNFCLGSAVKYIARCDHKGNPIQDLKKAIWYLEREVARREGASSEPNSGHPFLTNKLVDALAATLPTNDLWGTAAAFTPEPEPVLSEELWEAAVEPDPIFVMDPKGHQAVLDDGGRVSTWFDFEELRNDGVTDRAWSIPAQVARKVLNPEVLGEFHPVPDRPFEVGDRVIVTGKDGSLGHHVKAGEVGTVVGRYNGRNVRVRLHWRGSTGKIDLPPHELNHLAPESKNYKPNPEVLGEFHPVCDRPFEAGDRVIVTGNDGSLGHHAKVGAGGVVVATYPSRKSVRVRFPWRGSTGKIDWVLPAYELNHLAPESKN